MPGKIDNKSLKENKSGLFSNKEETVAETVAFFKLNIWMVHIEWPIKTTTL